MIVKCGQANRRTGEVQAQYPSTKAHLVLSRSPRSSGHTVKVVIAERPCACGYEFFLQGISLFQQLLELFFLLFNLFFCQIFHNLELYWFYK